MQNSLTLSQLLNIYYLESKIEWLKTVRSPSFVLPSLLFPLFFYLFFGIIFNRNGFGGQMPTYMLATYGTFGIMGPGLFSFGMGIAIERQQGWLTLKQISPMPVSAVVISRIAASLIFSFLIIIELFALAAVFGGVEMSTLQWLLMALTLLLGSLPFCLLGLCVGLWVKGQAAAAVVNLIYLPMALLSGLWMPIVLFPEWLQPLAYGLPSYHLSQLALKIVQLDQGRSLLLHLGGLILVSFIFASLAYHLYRNLKKQ